MRTADEMYQYVKDNKFIDNVGKVRARKHFEALENEISPGETVHMALIALLNTDNIDNGYFAVAITDSRIVMAQSGFVGRSKTKTVLLDNLNDVSVTQRLSMRHMEIDTIKDRIILSLNTWSNKEVGPKLKETVLKLKQSGGKQANSTADEIRKFKELYDDGIISEEEFNKKKQELLGI